MNAQSSAQPSPNLPLPTRRPIAPRTPYETRTMHNPPPGWDPHPAPRDLRGAPATAHILGMIAIGVLSVVLAPIAIPVILWIRYRDRHR
jgi:hypothetical protein